MFCTKRDINRIASDLAKDLKLGDIILLFGDLGSGKTFFTNKLCKHLGVKDIVNSPSYVLLNEYSAFGVRDIEFSENLLPNTKHRILHYDLYRLTSSEEALELGITDHLKDTITIIEWADIVKDILPKDRIEIYLKHAGNQRHITIKR